MNPEKRFMEAPEIKESLPKHEIAFAFIKTDNVADYTAVREEIEKNGLSIIYSDRVQLSESAVNYMYRDSVDEHFYPAMKKYLLNSEVVVLLVGGEGHGAQETLSELKKKDGKDGPIREKFQREPKVSAEDLSAWEAEEHPNQDDMTAILTQKNVIHTADSTQEALKSLEMILGQKFEQMKKKGNLPAELWGLFEDSENDNQSDQQ